MSSCIEVHCVVRSPTITGQHKLNFGSDDEKNPELVILASPLPDRQILRSSRTWANAACLDEIKRAGLDQPSIIVLESAGPVMKLSVNATINAPVDVVFATISDIEHWHETISAITSIEMVTPGPVAIGTVFRETRHIFGREGTEEMTVSEFQPPTSFLLTAENHGTFYRTEHRLTDLGGQTNVAVTFEGTPVTIVARLCLPLGWLMKNSLKKMIEADLADIKKAIENS